MEDFNGDKVADLLARKPDGTLWFYPGDGKGAYGVPRKIGLAGWEAFNALVSVRDFTGDGKNDLIARKPDGTLWIYPGTGRVDAGDPGYTKPKKIGTAGWNGFTALTGAGDLNGDGKNDLLARKSDGSLWLYRGTGTISGTNEGYTPAVRIGTPAGKSTTSSSEPGTSTRTEETTSSAARSTAPCGCTRETARDSSPPRAGSGQAGPCMTPSWAPET